MGGAHEQPRIPARRISLRCVPHQRGPDHRAAACDARRRDGRGCVHHEHRHRPCPVVSLPGRAGFVASEARRARGCQQVRRLPLGLSPSAHRRDRTRRDGRRGCVPHRPARHSHPLRRGVRPRASQHHDARRVERSVHGLHLDVAGAHRACTATPAFAIGWICGTIVFIGVVAAGSDLLLRVEAGLVAGSAISLAVFALLLHPLLKRGDTPDEESLVEAFHDLPLEP